MTVKCRSLCGRCLHFKPEEGLPIFTMGTCLLHATIVEEAMDECCRGSHYKEKEVKEA